ncbi:XPG I-region protein [Infundibulicybe gibba]|nr:XPG I-region protein [Infundibulicybe gibba]
MIEWNVRSTISRVYMNGRLGSRYLRRADRGGHTGIGPTEAELNAAWDQGEDTTAYYLHERKNVPTLPLSALSDSRLGIDASYYLNTLLTTPPSREPLLAATGGLPLALTQRIEADLRALERLHIKPVFVFPGLAPNRRRRRGLPRPARRWAKYEAGHQDQAQRLFEARAGVVQWDLWRMVLRIFRHRNVEFMVAPYLAWAQLIYLQRHPKSYIHAIYGPSDTLLYPGVDKLITSLDLLAPAPTFTHISKRTLLADLAISEDQFLDIGILVGFEHSAPFPPTVHEQALKATVDMVKYYKTGHAATIGYLEHFVRTRAMVRFSLVLSAEGAVMPLPLALGTSPAPASAPSTSTSPTPAASGSITAADIPTDLHEIFTHRLPDEIFFYLSRGLLSPQALTWLASGHITTEYKRFVREVVTDGQTGPRATALALVSVVANPFWGQRKVSGVFWFEQYGMGGGAAGGAKQVLHNSPQTAQLAERVAGWNVTAAVVEEELRRQNSATIDFSLCLGATATERLAARTKGKAGPAQGPLAKKDEVVANVIWRFLELRGFLLNTHTHSSLARAMYTALKPARLNDKFQDPLYLFLELVRAGVMHGHLWSGRAFSGGPSFGTDDEKSSMLLVMRVLSIVPLNFKPEPWSAPLSRELLVFNSFVRSLTRALRTLLEVTALNMLLRSDARQARDDLLDIALSLPFQTEVNTGFGVLAKVYLDALTHINGGQRVRDKDGEGVREKKALALEICEETFGGVKAPKAEVERGFRFWDVAVMAMRQLHSEGAVLRELIDQFEAARRGSRPCARNA